MSHVKGTHLIKSDCINYLGGNCGAKACSFSIKISSASNLVLVHVLESQITMWGIMLMLVPNALQVLLNHSLVVSVGD